MTSTTIAARDDEVEPRPITEPPPPERFALGDPLRALAALGVMGQHLVNVTQIETGSSLRESFGPLGPLLLGNLFVGLYIFFALSGYLIGRPFVDAWVAHERGPRVGPYVVRRLLRIVPAFWLFLTLAIVLLGLRGTSAREVLAVYGFAQDFDPSPLSYSFLQGWTLHSELVFYMLLPAVFAAAALVVRRNRLRWLLAGLALAWLASLLAIVVDPPQSSWGRFPTTLFAFVPGLLLAALAPQIKQRVRGARLRRPGALSAAGLAASAVLLGLYAALPADRSALRAAAVSLGMLALIGTALAREWGGLRPWRVLDNRVMHWLGERSYGIYVIHFVVIVEVTSRIDATSPAARLLIATAIAAPLTIALAALSWRFFERPILGLRRRVAARR